MNNFYHFYTSYYGVQDESLGSGDYHNLSPETERGQRKHYEKAG